MGPNNAQMQRVMASKVKDLVRPLLPPILIRVVMALVCLQDKKIYHFKKSIELNPMHADTYLNLGVAYSHQGLRAEAEEVMRCT